MNNSAFLVLLFLSASCISCVHSSNDITRPDESRFTRVVLTNDLDEPMQLEMMKDGRVIFAERKGRIKLYDPVNKTVTVIADIPVRHTLLTDKGKRVENEDGLQGVLLDPDFEHNKYIYAYYAPLEGPFRNILARYQWTGDKPDMNTKKVLLEIPVDSNVCCHVGGGMVFDKKGNLLLGTGENAQADDGFSTLDERPGNIIHDSQKSSGNTNDLRGKIIRIHPEPDATYSIPEGNLFKPGTPKTRPEIYIMGNRNPWRLTVDSKTNWIYWGEVGPGAGFDSVGRGPRAYDEFNQARHAANFGYPYFVGDNQAYWDYDYATQVSGEKYNAAHPVNQSPNNTGLKDLPPAEPAFISYPYVVSDQFPELGTGSSSAVGGPVYRHADFHDPARAFPGYYEGKWFITDWVRGWIMAVSFDKEGNYSSMERFLPGVQLSGPIDMDFGADGDLYILEYGFGLFRANAEARLVRIEYNKGNRQPVAKSSADKTGGSLPLTVHFSSSGTLDKDKEQLSYEWNIFSNGKLFGSYLQTDPEIIFTSAGVYNAVLKVTDPSGAQNTDTVTVIAGNDIPKVSIDLKNSNRSFYFEGNTIQYAVQVSDKEDGSVADKTISPSRVRVTINYVPVNFDLSDITGGKRDRGAAISFDYGKQLIGKSDCGSCHRETYRAIGPSFLEVAQKYRGDPAAKRYLVNKIINGGKGVWGNMEMPPHTGFSETNLTAIVNYISGLGDGRAAEFPVEGRFVTKVEDEKGRGKFIFRAVYIDKGGSGVPSQSSDDMIILRDPLISVSEANSITGAQLNYLLHEKAELIFGKPGSCMMLSRIDLTGIGMIQLSGSVLGEITGIPEGIIDIRLDAPDGKLLATTGDMVFKKDCYTGDNLFSLNTGEFDIKGIHDIYVVLTGKTLKGSSQIKMRDVRFIAQ